ncbi:MAG: HAD family hydrolase [Phycisphaerales bacterium]|nr:HAD family hydrolase [Phycisphaerales bacterium]
MLDRTPEFILFDLDGTMIDSVGDLADAANEVLASMDCGARTDAEIRMFVGNGVRSLLDRCLSGSMEGGASAAVIELAVQRFRPLYLARCTNRTTLLPHVRETLEALRHRSIRVAVLTNKPEAPTRRILTHFACSELLDGVVGGDTLDVRKPDPRVVQEAFRRCGVAADCNAWLVGDSSTDALTAARANITSIIVRGGYNHGQPVEEIEPTPDAIIPDIRALLELLVG